MESFYSNYVLELMPQQNFKNFLVSNIFMCYNITFLVSRPLLILFILQSLKQFQVRDRSGFDFFMYIVGMQLKETVYVSIYI